MNLDHFHVSESKVKVTVEAQSWSFGSFWPTLTSYKIRKYQFVEKRAISPSTVPLGVLFQT